MKHALSTNCSHLNSLPWAWDEESETEHLFCCTCYSRIIRVSWDDILDDIPVTGLCEHRGEKTPLAQYSTNQKGPRALCMECGCAVEHPDGPGSWEEVVFNRLLIEEEDEPALHRARDRTLPGP